MAIHMLHALSLHFGDTCMVNRENYHWISQKVKACTPIQTDWLRKNVYPVDKFSDFFFFYFKNFAPFHNISQYAVHLWADKILKFCIKVSELNSPNCVNCL